MPKPLHRRRSHRRTRIGAALSLVAAATITGVALAPHASADPSGGHILQWVCHPVNGDGQLGDGWNLIPPDQASSHIDEAAYAQFLVDGTTPYWKHESNDGLRHDQFATLADGTTPTDATTAREDATCPGHIDVEHLIVAQTITTSYTQTIPWSLTKTADKTDSYLYSPHASGAHSDTINWTVTATPGPAQDDPGSYHVSGSVDVENNGDNATTFTLSTDLIGATIPDCGQGTGAMADIAVGQHVTCTWTDAPGSKIAGPVTATATTDVDSYASDPTAITWGAPASVSGSSATLSDSGQPSCSGTVLASDGATVKHCSTTVSWSDAPCGNSIVTNTATLSTVADPASASVTVHRQCETFAADTAWAATAAKTNKYNGMTNGNWATWVKGPSGTWNLYAGQTKAAGTASISANGTVTITLANGFVFAPASSGANVHIQGYASPPSGNPAPGQFAFKKTCTSSPCSPGKVALANYYGIHLAVGKWVPDPTFGP
ncbi:MAG TPA: hypothetical protein VJ872_13090 [Nocardioides sp.]|nr:hypothetical protein [Nocardioides sp.]